MYKLKTHLYNEHKWSDEYSHIDGHISIYGILNQILFKDLVGFYQINE